MVGTLYTLNERELEVIELALERYCRIVHTVEQLDEIRQLQSDLKE